MQYSIAACSSLALCEMPLPAWGKLTEVSLSSLPADGHRYKAGLQESAGRWAGRSWNSRTTNGMYGCTISTPLCITCAGFDDAMLPEAALFRAVRCTMTRVNHPETGWPLPQRNPQPCWAIARFDPAGKRGLGFAGWSLAGLLLGRRAFFRGCKAQPKQLKQNELIFILHWV